MNLRIAALWMATLSVAVVLGHQLGVESSPRARSEIAGEPAERLDVSLYDIVRVGRLRPTEPGGDEKRGSNRDSGDHLSLIQNVSFPQK